MTCLWCMNKNTDAGAEAEAEQRNMLDGVGDVKERCCNVQVKCLDGTRLVTVFRDVYMKCLGYN
jgi:hypothetical protein